MKTNDIPQDLALAIYSYEEGKLLCKYPIGVQDYVGKELGSETDTGYLRVSFLYKQLRVHRIIWIMHFGDIPEDMCVDHIDKNRLNNKIENLRLLSIGENTAAGTVEVRSNNASGFRGVFFDKRNNSYRASLMVDRKLLRGPRRPNLEEAIQDRLALEEEHNRHEIYNRIG